MRKLGRGITTTVYLHFKKAFWPPKMTFLFHSLSGQVFWPARNPKVLVAYFGGAKANAHLLKTDLVPELLRQLCVIFSKEFKDLKELQEQLVTSEVRRWDTDPFAKMAYSYCPPGTAPLRQSLQMTCGNLLWAGEATHPTKASFAHGALEEGERAADEILSS